MLAALAGAFLYGFIGRERRWFPYYPLRDAYRALKPAPVPHRVARPAKDASALAQREAVGALTQLPYLQGYNPASGKSGVLVYDEARAFPGWNLALSAHRAQALLLNMRGLAHHRWSIESKTVWPDLKVGRGQLHYAEYWRRADATRLPSGASPTRRSALASAFVPWKRADEPMSACRTVRRFFASATSGNVVERWHRLDLVRSTCGSCR